MQKKKAGEYFLTALRLNIIIVSTADLQVTESAVEEYSVPLSE